MNGFLLGKLGRFPAKGEELVFDNLKFIIEEVSERAVEKIRVYKVEGERERTP